MTLPAPMVQEPPINDMILGVMGAASAKVMAMFRAELVALRGR